MKYKAMAGYAAKLALQASGGGLGVFFVLAIGLPLFSRDDLFGNDWPWVCGMLSAVTGMLVVMSLAGTGFQGGVSRKTMVRVYLSAQAVAALAMATLVLGFEAVMRAIGVARPSQVHGFAGFLQPGNGLVSWTYLVVLSFALGVIGLFAGLLMTYHQTKLSVWVIVVGFGLVPVMAITVALLLWFLAVWLLPGLREATYAIGTHPWALIGVIAVFTAVLAGIFDGVYRRLDTPQEVGGQP